MALARVSFERVSQFEQRMILNIGIGQGMGRFYDIFRAGPVLPRRVQDDVQCFFEGQVSGVSVIFPVHDKGKCPYRPLVGLAGCPGGNVGAGYHFAFPQCPEFLFQCVRAQFEYFPLASSAFIQAKNKPGPLGRAAIDTGPQAERTMIAMQCGHAAFLKFEFRAPNEGSVSKHPNVIGIGVGQILLHGVFDFFIRPQAELADMVKRFL